MTRHPDVLLFCSLCVLVCAVSNLAAQESHPITIDHADSLIGLVIDGQDARELIGHVSLSQDTVRITCDHMIQMINAGVFILYGNIVATDRTMTLHAPRGMFYRDDRIVEAFDDVRMNDGVTELTSRYGRYLVKTQESFFRDRVHVVDTSSVIDADSLWYYRTTRRTLGTGRVKVVSERDGVTITGGRLEHEQDTGYNRMTVHPVLVQVDTAGGGTSDTLVVRSRVMEAYRDSTHRLIAVDSVRLAGKEMSGLSGYAEFFSKGDSLILRRSPVVWYEKTQVAGDSMRIYLLHRKLERVLVTGNVVAVAQSDSLHPDRFDQMVGDTMQMWFEKKALKRIVMDARAISLYHVYDDTLANGLNKVSGDRIVMLFEEGKLASIKISGGVEGQYLPENLVHGGKSDVDIPGAVWRDDRPHQHRDKNGRLNVE